MIKTEYASESKEQMHWDSRVKNVPEGTIYQTTFAAKIAECLRKQKPEFLVAREGEKIVGQLLLLQGSLLHHLIADKPFSAPLLFLSSSLLQQNSFFYGPLVFDRPRYYEIFEAFIEKVARDNPFSLKDVYPPIHCEEIDQEKIKAIFLKHGFLAKPHATFVVDLTKTKEELWSALEKSSRYGVRRTQKQGVEIVAPKTREEFRQYYSMLSETFCRNNLPLGSFDSFLKGYAIYGNLAKPFMTIHEGHAVSALSVVSFNGIAFQYNVCHSNYGLENKIYGNDLLEWHAIETLKDAGARVYDLAGVTPEPQTEKEKNLFHFKSRWGGKLIRFYTYSKTKKGIREKALRLVESLTSS